MLPERSPAVDRALLWARIQAVALESKQVEVLHLVHGLLDEDEGRAAAVCRQAGLDYLAYRDEAPCNPAGGAVEEIGLHPAVERAFRQARLLASDLLGESSVVSEALLLALLRIDLRARQHLEQYGLDFPQLEAMLQAEQAPPVPLDEPLQFEEWTEPMQRARILDASANRAREGLRVVEDYCRFVLNDPFLSGQIKQLRHDLTSALELLPAHLLLQSRDTVHDVGTTISTSQEGQRGSLAETALASWKRVQEAIRSLEEYLKVSGYSVNPPEAGAISARLEALRYRSYTLEKAILTGPLPRQRLAGARLQVLLSGDQCTYSLERTIHEAAAGGASILQLREKQLSDREWIRRAEQVRLWTRSCDLLFIVNDRPDIARIVGADGVHLGQEDLPVHQARLLLGPEALIGVSTHNLEQVRQGVLDGASYLGIGAIFPTTTKAVPSHPGLEFVRQAMAETSLPLFPIGGINLGTIGSLAATGIGRAAVSAAIARADDPQASARSLLLALEAGRKEMG